MNPEHFTAGFALLKQISNLKYHHYPRIVCYQKDFVKLYHYQSKTKKNSSIPLLIVFATINKPDILDLLPENSFINSLLKNGLDVYLLDWSEVFKNKKLFTFDHYITDFLDYGVNFICKRNRRAKINILGICQGGVFATCYATLTNRIKNLILISTPIDFHTKENLISKHIKTINFNKLENLPGNLLTHFFISLRPFELVGKKYLHFIDNLHDSQWMTKFLHIEKWLFDAPDQKGPAFPYFIKNFYQENKLIKDKIIINNEPVRLKNLTLPILNIMATRDEIVPVSASRPLKKYVSSSDYTEQNFPAGHIGMYVSDKLGDRIPKAIAQWIAKR